MSLYEDFLFRKCHAKLHDEINDDTSQSSETAFEDQHKLKTHKIFLQKRTTGLSSRHFT